MHDNLNEHDISLLMNEDGNGNLVSKTGPEYIEALSKIVPRTNRNDSPITVNELMKSISLNAFSFSGKNKFVYTCDLIGKGMFIDANGKRRNERICPVAFANNDMKNIYDDAQGIVYMMTYLDSTENKEFIFKIGSTTKTMRQRIGSYNCGTVNSRKVGTPSTTNYRVLQTIVAISPQPIHLYTIDFSEDTRRFTWCGIESCLLSSRRPHGVEDILLKQIRKQFGILPIGNIQADASN